MHAARPQTRVDTEEAIRADTSLSATIGPLLRIGQAQIIVGPMFRRNQGANQRKLGACVYRLQQAMWNVRAPAPPACPLR